MNNRQLYLAWLRTTAPAVYSAAIRKATGQNRSVGGLTDDLVGKAMAPDLTHSFLGDDTDLSEINVTAQYMPDPVSFDSSSIDFQTPSFDQSTVSAPGALTFQSGSGSATGLSTTPASSGGSGSSIFNSVLQSVVAIGAGVLNYSQQNKLIALNTTRASQGLPPVNANGQVVSPYGTATTSPGLLAFEQAISGGSSMSMWLILGVLGIGAFVLLRPSKA